RDDRQPFLMPAHICPIVPATFRKARVGYEFVDIDSGNLGLDFDEALARIRTGEYGGLLYAHTYGVPITPDADLADVKRWDRSCLVIDDRCLCIPDLEPPPSNADLILSSTGS